MRDDVPIGRLAVELKLITPGQLEECLRDQEQSNEPLEGIFLRRRLVDTSVLARLLHEHHRRSEGFPELERYEIGARLGEGGVAVVYRARDRELDRPVAVKFLRDMPTGGQVARERFHREARLAAGLSHPNIVTVHDAGEAQGRLYLVMELVEGAPLSEILGRRKHETAPLLRLLEKAARGLAAAHEKGIVHRDVKPANILVTAEGEPKVSDFGLALSAAAEGNVTRDGSALGTPMYMAPEQVLGNSKAISPRTDVYALGGILYEILTGRPPHTGETLSEIFGKILTEEPVAPRKINPKVPRDLETICLKSLELHPDGRYATAGEFARDLRRHLDGEPIEARPISAAARLWRKAVKRRAVVVPSVAALLVLLAWGATTAVRSARKARRIEETLAIAAEHEAGGRIEEARESYRGVIELDRGNAGAVAGWERTKAAYERRAAAERARLEEAKAREEAIRLLEDARPALDRAYQVLYSKTADYSELVQRVDEAQNLIDEAVRKAPDLAIGHHLLGRAWAIKGWDDRAEACAREAVRLDPAFAPARFLLGEILFDRAMLATLGTTAEDREAKRPVAESLAREAAEQIEAGLRLDTLGDDPLRRKIAAAMIATARADWPTVRTLTREGIDEFRGKPGVEEFHLLAGYGSQGDAKLKHLNRAIALRPKYARALFLRASVRRLGGDVDGAIEDHTDALKIHPRFVEAYFNRGNARRAKGDLEGAVTDYGEAVRVDPGYHPAWTNRGDVRRARGDYEGAMADLDESIRLHPRGFEAWTCRGQVKLAKGDLDGAFRDFNEALSIHPKFAVALNSRGLVHRARRDFELAVEDHTAALQIDPKFHQAFNNRGNAKRDLGDLEGAIGDYDEAIRLQPSFADAWANRGFVRAQRGEFEAAVRDFEKALEIAPRDWASRKQVEAALARARAGKRD